MNPHSAQMALVLVAIASAAFLVALVLIAGCVTGLPPEPPFVETVAAHVDGGRP